MKITTTGVAAYIIFLLLKTQQTESICGYKSCNPVKDDMVNVHIVPHTHDDVGWIKTYENYYQQDVEMILTNVVDFLKKKPKTTNKKFIYVEMAFLKRWWIDQTEKQKEAVRNLINNGVLEIILGGWCMNDEATPYYLDIIDQHTLGFEFIRLNFGECGRPRVAWQIDPFGHSREQTSLFAQMGYDGMFMGRIDYQDKQQRKEQRQMEFIWKASDSLGKAANLFSGVLENVYWPPRGFCWDYWCSDPQIIHSGYPADIVNDFIRIVENQTVHFRTNHIMITMGSDFQYRWPEKWYDNLDKLMQLVNERQKSMGLRINMLYSTPSCYLDQLHRANITWPTKNDDFFPYAHRPHSFWTGYFTSRPQLKRLVRTTGAFLQACKQMDAFSLLTGTDPDIRILKEAVAVLQHHDGVSGTEKQEVSDDYTDILRNGIMAGKRVVQKAFDKLFLLRHINFESSLHYCAKLDLSACHFTEMNDKFTIVLYNPLCHKVSYWLRLPVRQENFVFTVLDSQGSEVEYQILSITGQTGNIPQRGPSHADIELVFSVQIPAMGFSTYFVDKKERRHEEEDIEEEERKLDEQSFHEQIRGPEVNMIENEFYTLSFDTQSGRMTRLLNKGEDVAIDLDQDFLYYIGYDGTNYVGGEQASGAYIFRPKQLNPKLVSKDDVKLQIYKGTLVQEARQVFSPWVSQVVRLYANTSFVEVEWTIGPIPYGFGYYRKEGREVITRYNTDLDTDGDFFTDLNGQETLKRTRDERKTWRFEQTEPVAGNYYPITTRASLKDERRRIQFTVLNDRSQGGGSVRDGELEIMLHRRLFYDDALGVDEALDELGEGGKGLVVRGRHYLLLNKIKNAASVYRPLAHQLYMKPLVAFTTALQSFSAWFGVYKNVWTGLRRELPLNVHILTLEQMTHPYRPVDHEEESALLLRLEHRYERHEHKTLSNPVSVHLQNLFTPFTVRSAIELTLGANFEKSKLKKMKWHFHDFSKSEKQLSGSSLPIGDSLIVELSPMEIRTFQLNIVRYYI